MLPQIYGPSILLCGTRPEWKSVPWNFWCWRRCSWAHLEVVSPVVGAPCSFSWSCGSFLISLWFAVLLVGCVGRAIFLIHWHLHSFLSCSSRIWTTSRCIVSVADIKAVLSNCGVSFPLVRIVGSYASIVASSPNSISFHRTTWFVLGGAVS